MAKNAHSIGQKKHGLAHRKARVVAVRAKQQNININVEDYGDVRTKRHGLEHKKGVCCRGKVVGHEHHLSWKISEALP